MLYGEHVCYDCGNVYKCGNRYDMKKTREKECRRLCFCSQKTAYDVRIIDWSSDVYSSDLALRLAEQPEAAEHPLHFLARLGQGRGVDRKIGRASCRERVCLHVSISVGGVSLKNQ